MVAAQDDAFAGRQLHAAGLPFVIEAVDIVGPDPIVLNQDVVAFAGDAGLAVVMRFEPSTLAPLPTTIPAPLFRRNSLFSTIQPCGPEAVDRPFLGGAGVFLDDQVL